MSCSDGDGTRSSRQRDLTGSITFEQEEQDKMIRQPAEYFSIVRRSAACGIQTTAHPSSTIPMWSARQQCLAK